MSDSMTRVEQLYAAGDIESAKYLLLSIVESEPENAEAHNNLGVIFVQEGKRERGIKHLKTALKIDPDNRDALLNLTDVLSALNDLARAEGELSAFIERHPDDSDINSLHEKAKISKPRQKPKLAIICIKGMESFLPPVVAALSDRFDIRQAITMNKPEMAAAIDWADVVWLEWANESTVDLTNDPKVLNGKHVICRLHSYEAFGAYIQQIRWERIHDLVFVGDSLKNIVLSNLPAIERKVKRVRVIPSGVDLSRFGLQAHKPGKKLAYLGSINYKKGPMLLFHAFATLAARDPSYQLHIGGDIQDGRYPLYFRQLAAELKLESNIHFEGRISDVPSWFADKNYLVCSSLLESQYMGIMEGMAAGIKPLVHNFVGARSIYPEHLIWNTMDDFVRLVQEDAYDSKSYRTFVEQHYSLEKQMAGLRELTKSIR